MYRLYRIDSRAEFARRRKGRKKGKSYVRSGALVGAAGLGTLGALRGIGAINSDINGFEKGSFSPLQRMGASGLAGGIRGGLGAAKGVAIGAGIGYGLKKLHGRGKKRRRRRRR